MALARVCSKGLRRPSACLRRELVVSLNMNLRVGRDSEAILVPLGKSDYRPSGASPAVMPRTGMHVVDPECGTPLV
jgi:hypothetical protein